jgi:hypothetical protein
MASAKSWFGQAVAFHRQGHGLLDAVRERLNRMEADSAHIPESETEQAALAAQLREVAERLSTGWLGTDWADLTADRFPLGGLELTAGVAVVRIGSADPLPGVTFPALVPLLGAGHLTIDRDARDPRVRDLLQSLLMRLVAAHPLGDLRVLCVDGGGLGAAFRPFRPLVGAEVLSEPATDAAALRKLLEEAEEQVRLAQNGAAAAGYHVLLMFAALPPDALRNDLARIAALAHAGPAAGVHIVLAGYPPPLAPGRPQLPALELATEIRAEGLGFRITDPPGEQFSEDDRGLNAPVTLDQAPNASVLDVLTHRIAEQVRTDTKQVFSALVPDQLWTESSVDGLETVVGRAGRTPISLRLDDATPHWLVGGRTGAGKTVFLLDTLYGLAARYSPDELALFLLDFKEGVSFTEFTGTDADPSWVPHARTVGIESDRQYGLAVLTELSREMNRRATAMKRAGVTKLSDLRTARKDLAMPRLLTVIDEFHVLLQGNDSTGKRAAAMLEEVSRKGRSYGVHLILASQSISGIDALFTKGQSIFGQFGQRIALPGGSGVLDVANSAADALPIGSAIINDSGGVRSANRRISFPFADTASVVSLRHRLWDGRAPGSDPPAVFVGYAEAHVEDDPNVARLTPDVRRRSAYLGRAVDVGLPSVSFALDASPGRHLAVVGTSSVGADVLHAATVSLARQHRPGTADFLLADFVATADDVVDELTETLQAAGHRVERLTVASYRDTVQRLAALQPTFGQDPTYLVVFGGDAGSGALRAPWPGVKRTGQDDLRQVLRDGPMSGVHVLGWWRGVRRLIEDLGNKEDVAGILALNVQTGDLRGLLGEYSLDYTPRQNRALFYDRHADLMQLAVPFVRPGRYDEGGLAFPDETPGGSGVE